MSFLGSFADAIGSIGKLVGPGHDEGAHRGRDIGGDNKPTLMRALPPSATMAERPDGIGNGKRPKSPRTPVLAPENCSTILSGGSLTSQVSTVVPSPFGSPQSDPCPSPFTDQTPSQLQGEAGFLENFARNVALGLFSDLKAKKAAQHQLESAAGIAMNTKKTAQRSVPPHIKGPISPVNFRTPTTTKQEDQQEADMIPLQMKLKPTLLTSPTLSSPMKDEFTPVKQSPTFISPMKDAFIPVKKEMNIPKVLAPHRSAPKQSHSTSETMRPTKQSHSDIHLQKNVVSPIVYSERSEQGTGVLSPILYTKEEENVESPLVGRECLQQDTTGHVEGPAKKSQTLELWQIGMHISAEAVGSNSNFAWKVTSLSADKAAAISGKISVGDYLWNIEDTCISMNFTSVLGIVSCLAQRKGENGKWSIGIRKATIDAPTVSMTLVGPLQNVAAAANNPCGSTKIVPKVLSVKPANSSSHAMTQEYKENMLNTCSTPPWTSSNTADTNTKKSEAFARQLGITHTKMEAMYEKLCALDKFLQMRGEKNEKMSATYEDISAQYLDARLAW